MGARRQGFIMESGTSVFTRVAMFCVLVLVVSRPAQAGEVLVAVAANFLNPMKDISTLFAADTGHRAVLIPGSSGRLYAQLRNGAPFDVFLSADPERPALLEEAGLVVGGSRFTYARGRLALWTARPGLAGDAAGGGYDVLATGQYRHLAIANPKTAPYGRAAMEVLKKWQLWDRLRQRIVQGENIAQAFQFVASGNAQFGFVALSQVRDPRFHRRGTHWLVSPDLHGPLRQDAVLLKRGHSNPAATALMSYLRQDNALTVIKRFGYEVE